ncbi:MAG: sulfotransferase domain-containing protein [Pseudomonadota bacterium]
MKRPTSIDEMRAQTAAFVTDESYARGLAYQPDPTDIFISPYAKCGTTWMQQIVHGLRTGGDMDFNEISEVVPWLELAHDLRQDIHAPQKARPHAFKSHLNWHEIPKGGRYITVLRDPVDAMVSLFRFLEGWHFETGSIALEDFATYFLNRDAAFDYWVHTASWWAQRDNADVLLLAYEHMKEDLPGTVERVADFVGIMDHKAREIATHQASFRFMKTHSAQFEEYLTKTYRDPACNLPPGGEASKVAQGQTGAGKPLVSAGMRALFAERWTQTMGAQFGFDDYAALMDQLRA